MVGVAGRAWRRPLSQHGHGLHAGEQNSKPMRKRLIGISAVLFLLLVPLSPGVPEGAPANQRPSTQDRSSTPAETPSEFPERRLRMVKEQIEARGVADEAVLRAMREVPRHLFVPAALRKRAYADTPLPIGEGQTISQPYVAALMVEDTVITANY